MKGKPKLFSNVILLILLLLSSSSNAVQRSVVVEKGALVQPGSVAWSPNSKRLALIVDHHLAVYDSSISRLSTDNSLQPVFLSWADNDTLLVTKQSGIAKEVVLLSLADRTQKQLATGTDIAAALWSHEISVALLIRSWLKQHSFGSSLNVSIGRLSGLKEDVFFNWDQTLTFKVDEKRDFLSGWLYQNLTALQGSLIIPEFHKPPVLQPYLMVKRVDPKTGNSEELFRYEVNRSTVPFSWNRNSNKLAFPNPQGYLSVIKAGSTKERVFDKVSPGHYPSWHPGASVIFFGSHLVNVHNETLVNLKLEKNSIGHWSPNGRSLAVVSNGALYLYDIAVLGGYIDF